MRIFYFILLAILCHSCIQLRISNHAELSEAESNKAASILKVFSQFLAQNKQNENQLQAETECAQEEEEEEEEEEVVQKNIPSFIPTEYDEVKSPIFVMEHDRSFNDQEVLELEDPCKIKQGFLSYVLRYEGNVIRAQPVFAVLNTKNLALFENENVDALIKSINYKRIAEPKLLTKWDKFHCFQLTLIGEEAELKNGIIPIENTEATLCAPDLKKMISWMNAIIAFHQCMIEIVDAQQKAEEEGGEAEIGPDGSHTIIDNPTMQYFKEKQKEAEEIGKQQILEAHDHEIVEELDEQKMEQNKEKMIAEKLQELTKKLARQQQNREHDRKTNDNKRIKIQEETEKLEQQEICLERALSMKSLEEERQAEMLIEQEEQKKESKVMDDAIELLLKTGESEGHKIEHEEEYLNSAALELQDKVRQLMVAETSEFERKQNADECTSPMLAGQNECYIKEVCSKHVHDNNESDISMRTLVDCLNIRKFCFICCQRNIGIAHEKDHLICMMDCKKQLYSDPPKPKKKKKNMKKIMRHAKKKHKKHSHKNNSTDTQKALQNNTQVVLNKTVQQESRSKQNISSLIEQKIKSNDKKKASSFLETNINFDNSTENKILNQNIFNRISNSYRNQTENTSNNDLNYKSINIFNRISNSYRNQTENTSNSDLNYKSMKIFNRISNSYRNQTENTSNNDLNYKSLIMEQILKDSLQEQKQKQSEINDIEFQKSNELFEKEMLKQIQLGDDQDRQNKQINSNLSDEENYHEQIMQQIQMDNLRLKQQQDPNKQPLLSELIMQQDIPMD